jgi:hypothetical protein
MNTAEQNNGDVWAEVLAVKASVLGEMGASGDDNAKLRSLTDWLRRELDLEAKYKGLMGDADRLLAERRRPAGGGEATTEPASDGAEQEETPAEELNPHAGKSGAADFRYAYLAHEKERGKHFEKVGRVYYRNDEGAVLGVTFSSEDKGKRESTWFLNLKDKEFHEAVLLCQTRPDTARIVHLPRAFIDKVIQRLSIDEKGMRKFNLARREGKFWLQVPGPTGWVDVQDYTEGELVVPRRPHYV